MFRCVDDRNLAFVFDVAVNPTRSFIHSCELGTATELNRCNYTRAFRVNHGARISGMIEYIKFTGRFGS